MMAPLTLIAIAANLVSLAAARWPDPPLSGHDFDFSADFPSPRTAPWKRPPEHHDEVKFSTQERPESGEVVEANPNLYEPAVITLLKPDDEARKARYIAFFEVSYIPTIDMLDDVLYSYPWIQSNLTVQDSGELATTKDTDSDSAVWPEIDGSEVRNATIQVWRQDDNLQSYIDSVEHGRLPMPLMFALAEVFSNTTSRLSYDFKRASIDFKIRNSTGEGRCDINSNGAPIPSVSRGETACLATATATSTGKGGAGGSSVSSTSTPSPTSKDNAAAGVVASFVSSWLPMVLAGVFIL